MIRRGPRLTLALICAAFTLSAGAADAAVTEPPVACDAPQATHHADHRRPSGRIQLPGNGSVILIGRVVISAVVPAQGSLRVVDRAGDGAVHVGGRAIPLRKGRAKVAARGVLFVRGTDLTVQITGARMAFSAAGIGRVSLRGTGRMRANMGEERPCPTKVVRLAPPAGPTAPDPSGPVTTSERTPSTG